MNLDPTEGEATAGRDADEPMDVYWRATLPPEDAVVAPDARTRVGDTEAEPDPRSLDDPWRSTRARNRRIRRFLWLLGALGLVLALAAALNPQQAFEWLTGPEDPPFRLVRSDRVQRQQPDGRWAALSDGADIQPGSVLNSGRGQTAVLRVRGGGNIRLDAATDLKVLRLIRREDGSYQVRSMLYQGRAFIREMSIDTLPVETELTRVNPRSATYEVIHEVAPDGTPLTRLLVYSGSVLVGLARGLQADIEVGQGFMVRVTPGRMGDLQPLERRDRWEQWNLSWLETEGVLPLESAGPAPEERLSPGGSPGASPGPGASPQPGASPTAGGSPGAKASPTPGGSPRAQPSPKPGASPRRTTSPKPKASPRPRTAAPRPRPSPAR